MIESFTISIIQAAHAAEEHAQASSGLPQFDTSTFSSQTFWSIVSFLVLVALLNKYVIPAIQNILDARGKSIQEEIDNAKKTREEAEKILAEYRRLLNSAREMSAQIMEETRKETAMYRESAAREIEEDIARRQSAALKEIEHAKRQAVQEVSSHAVTLAMLATEKLISKAVTEAEAYQMVNESIHHLEQHSIH